MPSASLARKQHQAADRDQAFAHLRGEVALAADDFQYALLCTRVPPPDSARLEDLVRDLVDLDADALEDVGGAVDHGIKQIHEHDLTRHVGGQRRPSLWRDHAKGLRLVIAHGDQTMAGRG